MQDLTALPERIASRIHVHENFGCWEWTGTKWKGYGRAYFNGGMKAAHRVVYTILVAPVDPELDMDHLCRNPACVNPAHLEPVTHAENVRRGDCARANRLRADQMTHCKNGHPITPQNTRVFNDGKYKACRVCAVLAQKRYQERRQAEGTWRWP